MTAVSLQFKRLCVEHMQYAESENPSHMHVGVAASGSIFFFFFFDISDMYEINTYTTDGCLT